MEQIRNKEYGGERPLFATHDLQLEDVTIHAGESALKECSTDSFAGYPAEESGEGDRC